MDIQKQHAVLEVRTWEDEAGGRELTHKRFLVSDRMITFRKIVARTDCVSRREADSCRLHSRYGLAFPIWRVRWRRSDKDALTIALAAAILFP